MHSPMHSSGTWSCYLELLYTIISTVFLSLEELAFVSVIFFLFLPKSQG